MFGNSIKTAESNSSIPGMCLFNVVPPCNTLKHNSTHCNKLQCISGRTLSGETLGFSSDLDTGAVGGGGRYHKNNNKLTTAKTRKRFEM